jgi:flagellar motor protein MotB
LPPETENSEFLTERRRRRGIYEDPLQHLWAISYSDLLMVVMTFFVFFYNVSDQREGGAAGMLFQLISSLHQGGLGKLEPGAQANGEAGAQGVQAAGQQSAGQQASGLQVAGHHAGASGNARLESEEGGGPNSRVLTSLESIRDRISVTAKDMGLATEREGNVLLIEFPDEFYRLGEYRIGPNQEAVFARLLQALAPFRSRLSAVLVGHADKVPVGHPIESLINSNLILSTLRAGRAAEYMMLKGWDPERVFAKGTGEHARVARSLTLQLEDYKAHP